MHEQPTNIFAKARLKEVIEHLCYYLLLCIFSADRFKCRAFANMPDVVGKANDRQLTKIEPNYCNGARHLQSRKSG